MLVSYNWLKEFVEFDKTAYEIADLLSMHGLEVAGIEVLKDKFSGVITSRILEIEKHPNADKLSICKVTDGQNEFKVVCGAKNIKKEQIVPLAKIGAKLPGNFVIKETKIRGEASFGMLCSGKELDVEEDSSGILILPKDTKLGEDVIKILNLDDYILDIEITPNRGDCLGILGVARELSTILNKTLKVPMLLYDKKNKIIDGLEVHIEEKELCNRYISILMDNIEVKDSPLWLKSRLKNLGIRPINSIVDITNYVLLEIGHPMHAFDYETIKGDEIKVRLAHDNEKIISLDNIERSLNNTDLIISDKEKPIAIAGVIGGLNTGVTLNTKQIVLESACFQATSIRKTAKRLGIGTESSYRFERGVCSVSASIAMERALSLIKKIVPEAKVMKQFDVIGNEKKRIEILFRKNQIKRITGIDYTDRQIVDVLTSLGFEVIASKEDVIKVIVPTFRNDIFDEVDLIEEIVRIDGYDKIPSKVLGSVPTVGVDCFNTFINDTKEVLLGLGFNESINYSFLSKKLLKHMKISEDHSMFNSWDIVNPISEEESSMRTSLLPKLLVNTEYNLNRSIEDLKLFEIGKIYEKNTFEPQDLNLNEKNIMSGVMVGRQNPIYWQKKECEVDFYYTKGVIKALLNFMKIKNINVKKSSEPYMDQDCSLQLTCNGIDLGFYGALDKSVSKCFGIEKEVHVWQLYLDNLYSLLNNEFKYKKISSYQMVSRDLSLMVPHAVSSDLISNEIKDITGDLFVDLKIFDVYVGRQIEHDYRNISFRLYLQAEDKTLSEREITSLQDKILKSINKKYQVKLR